MKIQSFSYHTHTNSFDSYDGHNSAEEMIKRAEDVGYTEIGISNHLIYHPNLNIDHQMIFNNYDKALDLYKKTIDEIRQAGAKSKIKVLVGFEVDFFPSAEWRNSFEKMLKNFDVDYLIGSNHHIWDKELINVINLYRLSEYKDNLTTETMQTYLKNHWHNLIDLIDSRYFDFVGHLDVCRVQGLCTGNDWDEEKLAVIEALAKANQPFELNTSGITKTGKPHPEEWMLKELQKRNVPIVISDDAHSVNHIAAHYETAEKMLAEMNYTNRWKLK